MGTFDDLVLEVRAELADDFRARLRNKLAAQPPERLVEQLLARCADANVTAMPRQADDQREARQLRIKALQLDEARLAGLVASYKAQDRDELLSDQAPAKGGPMIRPEHRSAEAERLLGEAKDVLHAVLFGDEDLGVRLDRHHRELLTITIPRAKLGAIGFLMQAATEIGAEGTWRDPDQRAHDDRAANTLIQVEYGETQGERVGNAIVATLKLINDLEVNEQVLYARMENVEESTLG